MNRMNNNWMAASVLTGLFLLGGGTTLAQGGQPAQSGQSGQNQTPAQQDKNKPQDLTLDNPTPPPVSAEEEAAFKAFQDPSLTDPKKKVETGEAFAQKYPQSRYLPSVYSSLTILYLQTGQTEKMIQTGEKEVALAPNDVQTLAILGQSIPRAMNSSTPNAAEQLNKAEKYSKQAIELTPTLPKPADLSDEKFTTAKNQTLAMAHSGLGLVDLRRGKFTDAIPELEQSVKLDPQPDPVNYYLLGMANQKASHFDDAVMAYNKCASLPSSLQATCKNSADEAKKLGATQLSAPK